MKPFIFGVGLCKTGTTSLSYGLSVLGWKSQHNFWKNKFLLRHFDNTGQLNIGARGVNAYFDALRRYYNKIYDYMLKKDYSCKFILTTREFDSWLLSCIQHVERNQKDPNYLNTNRDWEIPYRQRDLIIDINKWTQEHKEHAPAVRKFFQNKPGYLLEMNIIEGDGWDKLCPFLGVPIPDIPFPKLNVAPK